MRLISRSREAPSCGASVSLCLSTSAINSGSCCGLDQVNAYGSAGAAFKPRRPPAGLPALLLYEFAEIPLLGIAGVDVPLVIDREPLRRSDLFRRCRDEGRDL